MSWELHFIWTEGPAVFPLDNRPPVVRAWCEDGEVDEDKDPDYASYPELCAVFAEHGGEVHFSAWLCADAGVAAYGNKVLAAIAGKDERYARWAHGVVTPVMVKAALCRTQGRARAGGSIS